MVTESHLGFMRAPYVSHGVEYSYLVSLALNAVDGKYINKYIQRGW